MRLVYRALSAGVGLVCAVGPAIGTAGAASTSTIQGHVLFETTGTVPANAEVCYASEWPYTPTCVPVDPVSGAYTVSGLEAGEYQVSVQSTTGEFVTEYLDGTYEQFSSTLASIDGSSTTTIDFTVAPGASISGTVTHEGTTDPISNVKVCAEGFPPRCTMTAANGTYTLAALPDQPTVITFIPDEASGYVGETWDNQTDALNASAITFETPTDAVTGIDAQLSRGGTISGVVTDEQTGLPIDTFQVCMYGATNGWSLCQTISPTSSSAAGLPAGGYRFPTVPPDDYSLSFSSEPLYLAEFWDNQRTPDNAGTVTIVGEAAVVANAALAPLHGVFGKVLDDAAGFELPGVKVCAYQGSAEVECVVADAYGTFMFSSLPAGTYTLGVTGQVGYLDSFWDGATTLDTATTFEVVDGVDNPAFEIRLVQDPDAAGGGEEILTPEADTGVATSSTTTTPTTAAPTASTTTPTSTPTAAAPAATTTSPASTTSTASTTTTAVARVLGAQQVTSSPRARTGGSVMPMLVLAAAMFGSGAALLLTERRRSGSY